MKFTVAQSSLAKALGIVSRGAAANSPHAILAGVYVSAADGALEFQTTDLSISVRHKIAANVEEPGKALLSWKTLNALVKTLPDAAVSFEGDEKMVTLSCGKSNFRLNSLDPTDFPSFPDILLDSSVELPQALLSRLVDRVYRAVSKDNSRPILAGIYTTVENNTVRLVATDSFRLALTEAHTETEGLSGRFAVNIPGRVFHDVLSLPSDTDTILIGFNENQIIFVFGNTTYISRRIEGEYPNYSSLIASQPTTTITLPADAFADALKQVAAIASTNPTVRLAIDPEEGGIRVFSSSPEQGEATVGVPAEVDGNQLSIAFNYHYLMDCVSAAAGEKELVLELQDEVQPGIFKTFSDIDFLYLLMLVRI